MSPAVEQAATACLCICVKTINVAHMQLNPDLKSRVQKHQLQKLGKIRTDETHVVLLCAAFYSPDWSETIRSVPHLRGKSRSGTLPTFNVTSATFIYFSWKSPSSISAPCSYTTHAVELTPPALLSTSTGLCLFSHNRLVTDGGVDPDSCSCTKANNECPEKPALIFRVWLRFT